MKFRRHHNNDGHRQVKRGRTAEQVARLAQKLGLKLSAGDQSWREPQ